MKLNQCLYFYASVWQQERDRASLTDDDVDNDKDKDNDENYFEASPSTGLIMFIITVRWSRN